MFSLNSNELIKEKIYELRKERNFSLSKSREVAKGYLSFVKKSICYDKSNKAIKNANCIQVDDNELELKFLPLGIFAGGSPEVNRNLFIFNNFVNEFIQFCKYLNPDIFITPSMLEELLQICIKQLGFLVKHGYFDNTEIHDEGE